TIATMGRLMKNLDMALGSFQSNYESSPQPLAGVSSPSFGHKWLGLHDRAREEGLLALRDHTFTGLQSILDNPHGANGVPNFDSADCDLLVLPDNVNLIAALQLCDRALWYQ